MIMRTLFDDCRRCAEDLYFGPRLVFVGLSRISVSKQIYSGYISILLRYGVGQVCTIFSDVFLLEVTYYHMQQLHLKP